MLQALIVNCIYVEIFGVLSVIDKNNSPDLSEPESLPIKIYCQLNQKRQNNCNGTAVFKHL
jgi:hypothetical protein